MWGVGRSWVRRIRSVCDGGGLGGSLAGSPVHETTLFSYTSCKSRGPQDPWFCNLLEGRTELMKAVVLMVMVSYS